MTLLYVFGYLFIISLVVFILSIFFDFNTFFFGYLKLKWRRLFRTLIILGLILWDTVIFFEKILYDIKRDRLSLDDDFLFAIILIFTAILVIGLISWIVKPFVVSED